MLKRDERDGVGGQQKRERYKRQKENRERWEMSQCEWWIWRRKKNTENTNRVSKSLSGYLISIIRLTDRMTWKSTYHLLFVRSNYVAAAVAHILCFVMNGREGPTVLWMNGNWERGKKSGLFSSFSPHSVLILLPLIWFLDVGSYVYIYFGCCVVYAVWLIYSMRRICSSHLLLVFTIT